jgi:DUF917 family protein
MNNKEWVIDLDNIDDFALGCAVLGSGGGGDTGYDLLIAKEALETYGPVRIIPASMLEGDDLVAPIGFIGAPLVSLEKLPSGQELELLIKAIEGHFSQKVRAILPLEIGGANGLCPIATACRLGLPIVDADTIGRAFPELHMSSCALTNVSPSPAFIVDPMGNSIAIAVKTAQATELIARAVTVSCGSMAALSLYVMQGKETEKSLVHNTLSHALSIGKALRRRDKAPSELLREVCQGAVIAQGTISSLEHFLEGGFLKGKVTIAGEGDATELLFQNEYLLATRGGQIVAHTPDLIVVLDEESGIPVPAERLQYGLRVEVVSLPAPHIWKTEQGMAVVGPEAFGYRTGEKRQ